MNFGQSFCRILSENLSHTESRSQESCYRMLFEILQTVRPTESALRKKLYEATKFENYITPNGTSN